jgi:ribosomal-protein-alanine N-acetyltransferase
LTNVKLSDYISLALLLCIAESTFKKMKYLLTGQETGRLKFRLLELEDFDSWLGLFKAKDIAKYLDLDPKLSESELCTKWFDKVLHRYENELGGMNVLIDKKTNQLIGQCGLLIQRVEGLERMEIGYAILPQYWNQGFAFEAALKCKDFAFENKMAKSLISTVHVENLGSEKVALKNRMTFEKKIESFNLFSIDKETWHQQQSGSVKT